MKTALSLIVLGAALTLHADPVKVIFDTDMITDFDDVGALACLHALADAGECEILATVSCTRGNASVAAVEVINGYYGRADIPVGCAKGLGVLGDHVGAKGKATPEEIEREKGNPYSHWKYRKLAADYPQWVKYLDSDDAPDANEVYRRALASAPDQSVVICSVGFLTNLRRLLETKGDAISPLDGKALVAQKVKRWVAMACSYPDGSECNSAGDWESSKIALENWPTPVVFSDFQYGRDIFAGRAVAEQKGPRNPVKDVFADCIPSREEIAKDPSRWLLGCFGTGGRSAWDETAVLAAVRGEDSLFNVSRGTFRMVGEKGANVWIPNEENGPHVRITEKTPKAEVGRIIDELICRGPSACARQPLVPLPREIAYGRGAFRTAATNEIRGLVRFGARDAALPPEGYALAVTPKGIDVRAADDAGEFYALVTLRQMAVKSGEELVFPEVRIRDWPEYSWRGMLIDECRHFFGKETIKRELDLMALHKLNVLHWHLTDDQGWRIEIKSHPLLAEKGGVRPESALVPDKGWDKTCLGYDGQRYGPFFYTQEDIREIVAYAAARHITVVPEIEFPAHALAMLHAYPELLCDGAEKVPHPKRGWHDDETGKQIVCAGSDAALKFLEDVLDEVVALFPSKVVHLGGDEAPKDCWKACKRCQARIKSEGLKDENELQKWMVNRFSRFLAARGRRMIGWDEIIDGGLPENAMMMSWRIGVEKRVKASAGKGHEVVMTPTMSCYLDHGQDIPGDPFPNAGEASTLQGAFELDPRAGVEEARKPFVLGGQGNNWSEFTVHRFDLEWKMWPRGCGIAEALWTAPAKRDFDEFRARIERHRLRLREGLSGHKAVCAPTSSGPWHM